MVRTFYCSSRCKQYKHTCTSTKNKQCVLCVIVLRGFPLLLFGCNGCCTCTSTKNKQSAAPGVGHGDGRGPYPLAGPAAPQEVAQVLRELRHVDGVRARVLQQRQQHTHSPNRLVAVEAPGRLPQPLHLRLSEQLVQHLCSHSRLVSSALQLGTLRWKYSRFVRTIFWISDRRIPPGL